MDLTQDQLDRLRNLGISTSPEAISKPVTNTTNNIVLDQNIDQIPLSSGQSPKVDTLSSPPKRVLTTSLALIPLISISGLTFISFAGLILLKTKDSPTPSSSLANTTPKAVRDQPTSIPSAKPIQTYLLASQQYFTQALQSQSASSTDNSSIVSLLNQSLTEATNAVKAYPSDYRGYQQRGRVYVSLLDSQPALINQALSDLSTAYSLNPASAELSRELAVLYSRQGNAQKTIEYLSQTVALEPTKAQNFYDLARLQQQTGLIPQALTTYNQLLTIISDPSQKTQLEAEKKALENLIAQSGKTIDQTPTTPPPSTSKPPKNLVPSITLESPLLQADSLTGLVIAAPESSKDISIASQTDTNALSSTSSLAAGQKDITIANSNITSASQIYLTLVSGGKNQTLKVVSKTQGAFTAGFDTALNEEVSFKWWIIE